MSAFITIIKKIISDKTNENYSFQKWFDFCKNNKKRKQENENIIMDIYIDIDNNTYNNNNTDNNTITNNIFHTDENINKNIQKITSFEPIIFFFQQYISKYEIYKPYNKQDSKFILLKDTLNNMFLPNEKKNKFLYMFCTIQKIYKSFCKLAFLYKYKKSQIQIVHDLFMNPISLEQKNIICIYQNNSKFLFASSDLINIINHSICNSPYFFAEPIACKNPWNNIAFNKSNLYNIYFFIKNNNSIVPQLFQNYFLSNFHLYKFKKENEHLIREYAIQDYIKNAQLNELYPSLTEMIYENNYKKKLRIHGLFPKDKLLQIFQPYLLLYFKSKYSIGNIAKNKFAILLRNKMKKFILYNPKFGRKLLINTFDNNNIIYNERHIPFTEISNHYGGNNNTELKNSKIQKIFFTSHLTDNIDSDDDNIIYNYDPIEDDDGYDSF